MKVQLLNHCKYIYTVLKLYKKSYESTEFKQFLGQDEKAN